MKDTKTIVELRKKTEFGYTTVVRFITERHAQGGIEYYIMRHELWDDKHITYPVLEKRYEKVRKEYGNNLYKRYINMGYKKTDEYTFEPTEMDMR